MTDAKEELINQLQAFMGTVPSDARVVIKALAHPQVLRHTLAYFSSLDLSTMCTEYESPWDCEKEAEARYQTLELGWEVRQYDEEYRETWCDNCKERVERH